MPEKTCHCRVGIYPAYPKPPGLVPVQRRWGTDDDKKVPYANSKCGLCSGTGLIKDEDSILVDIHHGSTSESWAVVYRDGVVIHHYENDGAAYLRDSGASDTRIGLEELYSDLGHRYSSEPERDAKTRRRLDEFCEKHSLKRQETV